MGKYKNDFMVKGSKTLLEAFTKELDLLGYRNNKWEGGLNLGVFGFNGKSINSVYGYFGLDTVSGSEVVYTLPEQWNEALAAASELYVEERIIKDGDWVKWTDGNLYKLKQINGDDYNMLSWHSSLGFTECRDYFESTIKKKSTPATEEEIKEWLIKYFNTLGYGHGDRFLALRDTVEGESYNYEAYKCDEARVGSVFQYNPVTDILYNSGYGKFVVYERGQWINKKESLPKLHNYTPVISDVSVQYGCKVVKKNAIKKLNQFIKDFNKGSDVQITSVGFDDYLVDTKNIEIIAQNI